MSSSYEDLLDELRPDGRIEIVRSIAAGALTAAKGKPTAHTRASFGVERLEQRYTRVENDGRLERYDYAVRGLDFKAQLVYDEFGLVLDYPGIAIRAA